MADGEEQADREVDAVIAELDALMAQDARQTAEPNADADEAPVVPTLWPVVLEAFGTLGWRPETDGSTSALCRVAGRAASYEVFVCTEEAADLVRCWVQYPVRVPPRRRRAVCELLARATAEWVGVGHLGIDLDGGRVQWRHAIDVEDGLLSVTMVANMTNAGLWYCDHVFPAIAAVAFAGTTPAAAIALLRDE